ncbi:hypothetical protein Tco_0066420 [Tanacetum coccineum]
MTEAKKEKSHSLSNEDDLGDLAMLPNGFVLLRDYAIGDYAQAMLMNKNRIISEFCFRGDGTVIELSNSLYS